MRAAAVVAIVIGAWILLSAISGGQSLPLPQSLPFCGGAGRPGMYEAGSCALVVIFLWGLMRLYRSRGEDE